MGFWLPIQNPLSLGKAASISARWSIGRYTFLGSRAALPVLLTTGTEGPTTSAVVNWTHTYSARHIATGDVRVFVKGRGK